MQDTSPFFSIIIPVYNGMESGFPKCLDSIWNQPLDDSLYEVICVNDCSTDNTSEWLHEQIALHRNLTVIDNDVNIRQGGSRNKGVKAAKGNYIVFIDSDDYFHHDGIAKLYDELHGADLDVLVSDSSYQFKDHETNRLQLNLPYKEICTGEEFIVKNSVAIAPWRLAMKREYVIKNNLWFVEHTRVEDVDWGCKVLYYAKRIKYAPILLVHYIKGESGTSDNMYRNVETLKAHVEAANRTLDVANTLYSGSIAQSRIIETVQTYYYRACRYLFGSILPMREKIGIIKLIQMKSSPYSLVRVAVHFPAVYAVLTNCAVPVFRVVRKIHRKRMARKLAA